jgi:rod shape determining protein RodA
VFTGYDVPLVLAVGLLAIAGLVTMYSAGHDHGTRFADHGRNMALAFVVLFLVAQIPPQQLIRLAIPLYVVGLILLVATALPGLGITKKGATRWLSVGVTIQPSEILKIAMPLMLAWWFQRREGQLRALDFLIATILLLFPVAFIVKQPDLGTAILVLSAGLYVIFFAGLSWKLIVPVAAAAASDHRGRGLGGRSAIDVKWPMLRVPKNPLHLARPDHRSARQGFHIIQGEIAIGSGGTTGKGFMKGADPPRVHPRANDRLHLRCLLREFGLAGCCALVLGFVFLIFRPDRRRGADRLPRLLAGAIAQLFTYAFNMGMVSGILPGGRRPLPFISYGGTGDGHARPRPGHPDGDRQEPPPGADLSGLTRAGGGAREAHAGPTDETGDGQGPRPRGRSTSRSTPR